MRASRASYASRYEPIRLTTSLSFGAWAVTPTVAPARNPAITITRGAVMVLRWANVPRTLVTEFFPAMSIWKMLDRQYSRHAGGSADEQRTGARRHAQGRVYLDVGRQASEMGREWS